MCVCTLTAVCLDSFHQQQIGSTLGVHLHLPHTATICCLFDYKLSCGCNDKQVKRLIESGRGSKRESVYLESQFSHFPDRSVLFKTIIVKPEKYHSYALRKYIELLKLLN